MTEQDSDRYLTAEQAAGVLGTSPRTVHRYGDGGQLRTRKSGRRVMFHEGDTHRLARDLQAQRRGPDPDEVDQLRNQLQQATYRIGYLEAQLERRMLPDHEMQLRAELARSNTERDQLERRLRHIEAPWRTWLLVALFVVIAVLSTILVVVLIRPFG